MVRTSGFHPGNRGSSPLGVTTYCCLWSISSVGRALPLQGRCHKFESCIDHHLIILYYYIYCAVVVQLVRMSPCHGEGREFESRQPRHLKLRNNMKTIIVLFSGSGTNLQNIITTYQDKYKITTITNNKNANGIKICEKHNIKCLVIDEKSFEDRLSYNKKLVQSLKSLEQDLIVLAGYMRIIPKFLLDEIHTPIINLHPSLLPRHKGLKAIEKSFEDEYENAGVTVHYVSLELDSGKTILQLSFNKKEYTTFNDFKNKIKTLEYEIMPMAIDKVFSIIEHF